LEYLNSTAFFSHIRHRILFSYAVPHGTYFMAFCGLAFLLCVHNSGFLVPHDCKICSHSLATKMIPGRQKFYLSKGCCLFTSNNPGLYHFLWPFRRIMRWSSWTAPTRPRSWWATLSAPPASGSTTTCSISYIYVLLYRQCCGSELFSPDHSFSLFVTYFGFEFFKLKT
jgi:hypothetical protein